MNKLLDTLRTEIVGGEDGAGGGSGPTLVLLHGFGAPGDDLVPLAGALHLARGARALFPEAPLSIAEHFGLPRGYPGGPRAWWMIDVARFERAKAADRLLELTRERPEGMDDARAALEGMLDAAARDLGVDPARTVIGGFSQGAMLATDLALGTDRALAGLVVLSGTILDEISWTARLPARRGLPVFQSHGTLDPLLPFEVAERWTGAMKGAGLAVDAVTFRGGHEIPRPVLSGLDAFLARTLV